MNNSVLKSLERYKHMSEGAKSVLKAENENSVHFKNYASNFENFRFAVSGEIEGFSEYMKNRIDVIKETTENIEIATKLNVLPKEFKVEYTSKIDVILPQIITLYIGYNFESGKLNAHYYNDGNVKKSYEFPLDKFEKAVNNNENPADIVRDFMVNFAAEYMEIEHSGIEVPSLNTKLSYNDIVSLGEKVGIENLCNYEKDRRNFIERVVAGIENLFEDDRLAAVRADGDDAQGNAREFADAFDIVAGCFRQFIVRFALGNIGFPARHFFINRFDVFQDVEAGRIFFQNLALIFITRADFDGIQVIEDVQAGNSQVIEAVQHSCVFDDSRIEPAAAAGTTGDSTKFMACIAQVFANFVELFCRERASADAGRIGFDDADDIFHTTGADARTGAGAASRRIGAGNEGICTMVEVEHSSLSPFKEDFLAFTDIEIGRIVRILYILANLVGIAEVFFEDFIIIEAFAAIIFFKETVFKVNIDAQFLGKDIAVHEVADADAYAVDFVGIARSDAVFRRADLSVALELFIFFINADMIRHDDMRTRGNFQFADLHAFGGHAFDFFKEDFRIDNDAAADDVRGALTEDAGRDAADHEVVAVELQRVAGVRTALEAGDGGVARRKHVHDLSFPLISPLESEDNVKFLAHICRFVLCSLVHQNGRSSSGLSSEMSAAGAGVFLTTGAGAGCW